MQYSEIIDFWFTELEPKQWYVKDEKLDQNIADRFSDIHRAVRQGECYSWREEPQGWLAEVIILDQFSRNMFRDTAAAFAQDPQALCLAQEAISSGASQSLNDIETNFLYMPFMHSESAVIHEMAVGLFTELSQRSGNKSGIEYELKHKAIIDRFGRYPHRNEILGRESSSEELAFLEEPNSSF